MTDIKGRIVEAFIGAVVLALAIWAGCYWMSWLHSIGDRDEERLQDLRACYQAPGCMLSADELAELKREDAE
jgi:hypothetical protein